MLDKEARFVEATERLYTAFADYPLNADTGMCPCCHRPEDELNLHLKPLRELSAENLWYYSTGALLTWGDEEDFKHFLPRLFELAVELPFTDLPIQEVVFEKLQFADWQGWPEDEQIAVENFLMAAWEYALTYVYDDEGFDVSDLICSIGQAVDDLTPYLEAWEKSGIVGLWHLSELVTSEVKYAEGRYKLKNTFWIDDRSPDSSFYSDRTTQMNQVIEWLQKPTTREIMEITSTKNPGHPYAEKIAQGAEYLRNMTLSQ